MGAPLVQPYITTISYWITDSQFVAIPVLSVSASPEDATANAQRVVALMALSAPDILAGDTKVTFSPAGIPDAAAIEFLRKLAQERPDLAQHAAPARLARGRQGKQEGA